MQYTFITNPQYKYHIQNISNSFFPNLSLLSFILLIHKHTESNTLLLFFLFWASYFLLDQLIRKIKGFILPSHILSAMFFLYIEFLIYTIFLLSENVLLTFITRHIYWWQISIFVCMRKYFSFTFEE